MYLNFLKRKKTLKQQLLLFHYLFNKQKKKQLLNGLTVLEKISPDNDSLENEKSSFSSIFKPVGDDTLETNDGRIYSKNWEKVTGRIGKLLLEISESQKSDQTDRDRESTVADILDNKSSGHKQDDSQKRISSTKSQSKTENKRKNSSSKSPLDVVELQSIAAMAKKIKATSKINKSSQVNTDKQ